MSERVSSVMILLGGLLVILALWALSIMAVRWDTRRRSITELERRAWIALTVVLPLFGFSLYLFMRVIRQYLTPQTSPAADPHLEQARARVESYHVSPAQRYAGEQRHAGGPVPAAPRGPVMAYPTPDGQGQGRPQTVPVPPQPPQHSYALGAVEGPHLGQHFILSRLPAQIGRGPEQAIPLDADLNVSRRHAEVYEWNGALRIRDLRSAHGTLVNGTRITDHPLLPGDRVTIGATVLIVRDTANPPA